MHSNTNMSIPCLHLFLLKWLCYRWSVDKKRPPFQSPALIVSLVGWPPRLWHKVTHFDLWKPSIRFSLEHFSRIWMYHVYIWVEANVLSLLLFCLFKVTWKTHRHQCQYVGDILNAADKRKCALSAMISNNLHKIWRKLCYQTQMYADTVHSHRYSIQSTFCMRDTVEPLETPTHAHNASLPKISSIMQINIYIERELSEVHFRKRQLMNSLFYSKKICCVFCIYEMSIWKERTTCRDSWHPKFLVQKKWIFISAQVYTVHCTLCTHTVRLDRNHSWFEHFIYRNGKYLQDVCHATEPQIYYVFGTCQKYFGRMLAETTSMMKMMLMMTKMPQEHDQQINVWMCECASVCLYVKVKPIA